MDFPQQPTDDQHTRHLQEQVRRLRTRRLTQGDLGFEVWQPRNADLFNDAATGGGWYLDGYPAPTFVRQGNIVHVMGALTWAGAPAGYPYGYVYWLRANVMPAQFRPLGFRRWQTYSAGGGTAHQIWMGFTESTGYSYFDNNHTDAARPHTSDTGPFGLLAAVATSNSYITLDFSYPIEPVGRFPS